MAEFVANSIIKKLILANKTVKKSKVAILGITFKENCPDTRNSKVVDVIKALREYGIEPIVTDPLADKNELANEYGIELVDISDIRDVDCLVITVAHNLYKNFSIDQLDKMFARNMPNEEKVIIDVKGIYDKQEITKRNYVYWRL